MLSGLSQLRSFLETRFPSQTPHGTEQRSRKQEPSTSRSCSTTTKVIYPRTGFFFVGDFFFFTRSCCLLFLLEPPTLFRGKF